MWIDVTGAALGTDLLFWVITTLVDMLFKVLADFFSR